MARSFCSSGACRLPLALLIAALAAIWLPAAHAHGAAASEETCIGGTSYTKHTCSAVLRQRISSGKTWKLSPNSANIGDDVVVVQFSNVALPPVDHLGHIFVRFEDPTNNALPSQHLQGVPITLVNSSAADFDLQLDLPADVLTAPTVGGSVSWPVSAEAFDASGGTGNQASSSSPPYNNITDTPAITSLIHALDGAGRYPANDSTNSLVLVFGRDTSDPTRSRPYNLAASGSVYLLVADARDGPCTATTSSSPTQTAITYCESETMADLGVFPQTSVGVVASIPCGSGLDGNITRICCGEAAKGLRSGLDRACTPPLYGVWMWPSTEGCDSTVLNDLADGSTVVNADNVRATTAALASIARAAKGKLNRKAFKNTFKVLNKLRPAVLATADSANTTLSTQRQLASDFAESVVSCLASPMATGASAFVELQTDLGNPVVFTPEAALRDNVTVNIADYLDYLTQGAGLSFLQAARRQALAVGHSTVEFSANSTSTTDAVTLSVAFVNTSSPSLSLPAWPHAGGQTEIRLPPSIFQSNSNATGGIMLSIFNSTSIAPSSTNTQALSSFLSVQLEGMPRKIETPLAEPANLSFILDLSSPGVLNNVAVQLAMRDPQISPGAIQDLTLAVLQPTADGLPLRLQASYTVRLDSWDAPRQTILPVFCGWIDLVALTWKSSGVTTTFDPATQRVTCQTNHLTSFAVLVGGDEAPAALSDSEKKALSIITYVGCGLSIAALLVTILTLFWLRNRKFFKVPQQIALNLSIALVCLQAVFLLGIEEARGSDNACTLVGVLLHFFVLVTFAWMFGQALHLYTSFVKVLPGSFTSDGVFRFFFMAAWLVPLAIVSFAAAFDSEHYSTDDYCWIDMSSTLVIAFALPLGLVIVANLVIFFMSIRQIRGASGDRVALTATISFFFLLGFTWIIGFFVAADRTPTSQFAFAILNAAQGVFVVYFHCLRSKPIMAEYRALLMCSVDRPGNELFHISCSGNEDTYTSNSPKAAAAADDGAGDYRAVASVSNENSEDGSDEADDKFCEMDSGCTSGTCSTNGSECRCQPPPAASAAAAKAGGRRTKSVMSRTSRTSRTSRGRQPSGQEMGTLPAPGMPVRGLSTRPPAELPRSPAARGGKNTDSPYFQWDRVPGGARPMSPPPHTGRYRAPSTTMTASSIDHRAPEDFPSSLSALSKRTSDGLVGQSIQSAVSSLLHRHSTSQYSHKDDAAEVAVAAGHGPKRFQRPPPVFFNGGALTEAEDESSPSSRDHRIPKRTLSPIMRSPEPDSVGPESSMGLYSPSYTPEPHAEFNSSTWSRTSSIGSCASRYLSVGPATGDLDWGQAIAEYGHRPAWTVMPDDTILEEGCADHEGVEGEYTVVDGEYTVVDGVE